jgi:NAD(P)-dependent dehydrogenase (short-subunit alcohol dehydrogenase family)/uncharacterized OB-fold protein
MTAAVPAPAGTDGDAPELAGLLPPQARSRVALGLTAAAARGDFELQVCGNCAAVQYPPREACHRCLGVELRWTWQSGEGVLIAGTTLSHSNDEYFRRRLPWRVGMVRLDAGPIVIVHLHGAVAEAPARVRVLARLDRAGQAALVALPTRELTTMADDQQLHDLVCDPRNRTVLVTDIVTPGGQALARALLAAGATSVWGGHSRPLNQVPSAAILNTISGLTPVPLDLTDPASVQACAAQIGSQIDILIHNATARPDIGVAGTGSLENARAEMDINYFGLLRLMQEFAPAMRARAVTNPQEVFAWVNVLSVFALASYPLQGAFSASQAAALSLSQCLRAEMQTYGIRVSNIFPGPLDDESHPALPPPKLSADELAAAVVQSLREGIEDVYPGAVAQECLSHWRENPKVLERVFAAR